MLRKRTSFKPNLKQVAPLSSANTTTKAPAGDSSRVGSENEFQRATGVVHHDDEKVIATDDPQACPSTTNSDEHSKTTDISLTESRPVGRSREHQVDICNIAQERLSQNSNQVSDKRVQEAITQLTGQKFEPIKSLSLRSSANKNVKIKDLLFFNPPMTKDQKKHKKSISQARKNEQRKVHDQELARASLDEKTSHDELCGQQNLMPKVKMGPDGKLVLDERSTVISRSNAIKDQEAIVEDNEEIISKTNYESYRRKPSSTSQAKWSLEDTKKFYHALRILGTDFSLMESLLFAGFRSRTELHKKFKREERLNKSKIDIALSNRIALNSDELDDLKELLHK